MADNKFYITLFDKFEKSSLTELEFTDEKIKFILRKNGPVPIVQNNIPPQIARYTAHAPAQAAPAGVPLSQDEINKLFAGGGASSGGQSSAQSSAQSTGTKESDISSSAQTQSITAPIVATFYTQASPDSPPFVKKGDRVKKGQTLCILEAMKMMNHLEAEFDCEILDIKVSPGDLVEFGQALFEVKKI